MVNETMIDNAVEIAKEEICDIDNVSGQDLDDFRRRFNHLIDIMKDACDLETSNDSDD